MACRQLNLRIWTNQPFGFHQTPPDKIFPRHQFVIFSPDDWDVSFITSQNAVFVFFGFHETNHSFRFGELIGSLGSWSSTLPSPSIWTSNFYSLAGPMKLMDFSTTFFSPTKSPVFFSHFFLEFQMFQFTKLPTLMTYLGFWGEVVCSENHLPLPPTHTQKEKNSFFPQETNRQALERQFWCFLSSSKIPKMLWRH